MKRVMLVNPPQLNSIDDRIDPPLGLMYIAGVLEQNGVDVGITDLAGRRKEDWVNLIPPADVYGMTIFSASLNTSRDIARTIKQQYTGALIVAGGPHPTSLPNETLNYPEFDFVFTGEGEYSFLDFIRSEEIGEGRIINSKPIGNIDELPLPARHLVDMQSYTREVEGQKATSILTSRGCPYNCNFCCKDVLGRKVKERSTRSILEEIAGIQRDYDIHSFIFYDDIFTLNRRRLPSLCEGLKAMNVTFRCNGRAGINTYDDYVMLREAGCQEIAFGIESGSQVMLDKMGKRTTVKRNIETILTAKRAGLLTKAYLIVGFPGETQETVDETKRFMDEADPDKFTVFQFVPLPGCDVYKHPQAYGVTEMNQDWDQFFNIAGQYEGGSAFRTEELSPERVQYLHDDLIKHLMDRQGRDHGQTGTLQSYYKRVDISRRKK
jgi:anaerobic magnesium-protoporphyrin IX monomethyl ester cyclase